MRSVGDKMLNTEYLNKVHYFVDGYVEVLDVVSGKKGLAYGGFSTPVLKYDDGKVVSVDNNCFDDGEKFVLGQTYNKTGFPIVISDKISRSDIENGIVDLERVFSVDEIIIKASGDAANVNKNNKETSQCIKSGDNLLIE